LTGSGVRMTRSGATISSIVFEMSSASPLFVTSWKRLKALLLVSSGGDIESLL
jgi:hypothetical protein